MDIPTSAQQTESNLLQLQGFDKKIILQLDGNAWFATFEDFINLQESIAGFGYTPNDAVAELLRSQS